MHRTLVHILLGALFCFSFPEAHGQPAVHTRVFRPSGSYATVLSLAPNGSILAKSGDSTVITIMDGYTPRQVQMPEVIAYRIQQSRSGQIWSVSNDGLLLYHAGAWTAFSLPEVRAFLAEPARHLRQISLLPAEVNHTLLLLPDRLLDFDASTRQTRVLRYASQSRIGEFTEIQDGWDESIWIAGAAGVAHIRGPARHVTAQSIWTEYLLPDTNRVNTLQHVFENPAGELVGSANNLGRESRGVAWLRAGQWSTFDVPGEKIRQAWRAWDEQLWGFSTVSLFRMNPAGGVVSLERVPVTGAQYDMAAETNGVFWVASGEGVVRYAPYLWRTPPLLEDLEGSVHSLLLAPEGSVWLSTPAGLILQKSGQRQVFQWPEEIENGPPPQEIYLAGPGRVLVSAPNRPFVLDAENGRFRPLSLAGDAAPRLVGELQDGGVVVWFDGPPAATPLDLRILRGDQLEPIVLPTEGLGHITNVFFVKESSNGDLWISTGGELLRYRKSSGTIERHGAELGLRTERIYALEEVGDGRIWCGTASRIFEYRGQRWQPILNTADHVTGIVSAVGSTWVSTLSGIHRFQENSWFTHGLNEGLPNGAVYGFRISRTQQLWASTSRGAFIFHPDADTDPPRTFPPRLDEEQTPATGRPIPVEFHAHDKWDYTPPGELLFSYRLDEGSWSPFSNISARVFQKLPAGLHSIEVISMDRNGNKSPEAARIEFSVIIPWLNDPRLLSVLVLAGIVSAAFATFAVNKHFQLKRSYAEVEKIVEQRTRDLNRATQELVHAQKMRALGTMAAGIAHDFNNILSIIKGSAQIIENHLSDKEKIRTRVSRIQTVVEQGAIIVKALLGLGKTGGKDLTECDLAQLLHETRKLLADRFPPSVQIQINVSPDVPRSLCASEVLQQILLNLILNAAEAMHNRGVIELAASLTKTLPPKLVLELPADTTKSEGWVIISVIDQGGGISEENLARIFEPFFTTKAFSSRRGIGLGLSMVYELAKQLGYGIGVESRVGQGSTFSIVLPVIRP